MEISKTFNSVADFIAYWSKLSAAYNRGKPNSGYDGSKRGFIFRGQKDSACTLLPKWLRPVNGRIAGYVRRHTELIGAFVQEASPYVPGIENMSAFDQTTIAQHYGVPTRMLDWTGNPLVALYFACIDGRTTDGAVYALHSHNFTVTAETDGYVDEENEKANLSLRFRSHAQVVESANYALENCNYEGSGIKYPIIVSPRYMDSRMAAQSSWLMVWGDDDRPLEDIVESLSGANPDRHLLEGFATDLTLPKNLGLFKWIIPAESKRRVIFELNDMGVNVATLCPGLEGIGRRLCWLEAESRQDGIKVVN